MPAGRRRFITRNVGPIKTNRCPSTFRYWQHSQQTAEDAYDGTPLQLPGEKYASHFDLGGQGVGYSDSTPTNTLGVGRRGYLARKCECACYCVHGLPRNGQRRRWQSIIYRMLRYGWWPSLLE